MIFEACPTLPKNARAPGTPQKPSRDLPGSSSWCPGAGAGGASPEPAKTQFNGFNGALLNKNTTKYSLTGSTVQRSGFWGRSGSRPAPPGSSSWCPGAGAGGASPETAKTQFNEFNEALLNKNTTKYSLTGSTVQRSGFWGNLDPGLHPRARRLGVQAPEPVGHSQQPQCTGCDLKFPTKT